MAYEDKHHITAGLAVAKNAGQDPSDEGQYHDVFYITAGLAAEVLVAAGNNVPQKWMHYQRMRAG